MNILKALVNRNLKVFLRNKAAVFFSFLAVIIIIVLYALFLGKVQVDNIKNEIPAGVFINESDIAWLVNSWIMAGLIAVNTVTVTLGTYGIIIDDIELKTNLDFLSSPIKRSHVVLGYIISSWILTIVLTVTGFFVFELYIVSQGGQLLSLIEIIEVISIIILSVISFSAVLFFIISFVKTSNALGTFNTIIGTFIGFLAGIYIPPIALPDYVKLVISVFPVSYSASMLRKIATRDALQKVFHGSASAIEEYSKAWGIDLYIGNYKVDWLLMILSLVILALVFFGLSVLRVKRNKL